MLKTQLLNTLLFIDNAYLDKYCALINANVHTNKIKNETQKHHILGKAYFRHLKLNIDNSNENVVNLLYIDHLKAHYYLCKCTKDWYKYCCLKAFDYLFKRKNSLSTNTPDELILEQMPDLAELRLTVNKAEQLKNQAGKWVNNGLKQRYVRGADLTLFLEINQDYRVGKLPVSAETEVKRQNTRNAKLKRDDNGIPLKRCVINNGNKNKFIYEYELQLYLKNGWCLGRWDSGAMLGKHHTEEAKQKNRQKHLGKVPFNKGKKGLQGKNRTTWCPGHTPANRGLIYINNSQIEIKIPSTDLDYYVSIGYIKGRLPGSYHKHKSCG